MPQLAHFVTQLIIFNVKMIFVYVLQDISYKNYQMLNAPRVEQPYQIVKLVVQILHARHVLILLLFQLIESFVDVQKITKLKMVNVLSKVV